MAELKGFPRTPLALVVDDQEWTARSLESILSPSGYAESFLSFVVGHGAFELTAIVLSGAAGLRLGFILLNPGRLTRLDALRRAGPELITIVLGAAAMLLIAALIEGFWSPSAAPPAVKFAVGALLWVIVLVYLFLAGPQGAKPLGEDRAF